MSIDPFDVHVPQFELDDLQHRLSRIRWPEELPNVGWAYGMPVSYIRDLIDHWRSRYDWRAREARLNNHPQFTTEIDGQKVHFLHVRSPQANAFPLILTHGWQGSVVEYLDIADPLSNPKEGGQAYDLVIPSIPGYGFSGPARERGWNRERIAKAWAELMTRLGYSRYGAVGNDAGSLINPELARLDPDHVAGIHVTQLFSFPSGDSSDFLNMSDEEQEGMQVLQQFMTNKSAFSELHSTQPQTRAFALADSPIGLLAWNAQLFAEGVDKDFILDSVMVTWLTGTSPSSTRLDYEDAHSNHSAEPTTVPVGLAMFKGDFISIRRFAERDHKNIVQWTRYDRGERYAAHLATDLLAEDIRRFFESLDMA